MPAIGRKCLALLLTVGMLFSLVGTAAAQTHPSGPPTAPFLDTRNTKFQEAVDALYALQVVAGMTQTAYDPHAQVTRAQMAALVMRALGTEVKAGQVSRFPDVAASHWASAHIDAAADAGIIRGGTDGLFRPDEPVTYAEMVTMLIRAVDMDERTLSYPTGYVLLASQLGLVEGLDWGLDMPASRGDVAIALYRTVFTVPRSGTGPTLSQSIHKLAAAILIEPAGDFVARGTTSLTARAVDYLGMDLDGFFSWSVTSGPATVDRLGNLNVTGSGPVTVMARMGDATATRTYSVIDSLKATAAKTVVSAGSSVQLSAAGTAAGRSVAVTPSWQVVSGGATVSSTGLVTVTGDGPITVRAALGTLTSDVTLQVVNSITISPATVITAADQAVQFTASVVDGAGKKVDVPVTWSVSGGGTIDQNGKLTAGSTGATVTAQAASASGSASVQVLDRIEITSGGGSLAMGTTQAFAATAYTKSNEAVTVPIKWSVEPSGLGFFDSKNVFFAANPGTGNVVASYGGLAQKVAVSVGGTPVAVQLSAAPNSLPANGTSTTVITARLVDANGITASGGETVMFSMSNSALGTLNNAVAKIEGGIATATLTAGTASGTYAVMVSVPGTGIPGASMNITTSVPAISHVKLEAYPNPIAADNTSRTTITAKLIDATGAPISNYTGNVINVSLTTNNTIAGVLNTTMIQIGVGQSSGTAQFNASAVPGTTTISGTSNYPVTATSVSSLVVGAAHRLKIRSDLPTAKANGIEELSVQVEVQDINGNVRTGDNSVLVSLSATSGTNSISVASQQTQFGVATFKLKTTKSGTYALSAWSLNTSVQTATSEATFAAGSPYKLSLAVDPAGSLAADATSKATLRARVLDANDNLVTTASHQITFVRDGISANVTTLPSNLIVNAVNGEATIQVTASAGVGVDYFRARSNLLLESSQVQIQTRITGVPVKLVVQPLPATSMVAGSSMTVSVWVQDQLNQLVTGDNGRMITLLTSGGATNDGPKPTVNGVATFTVTSTKAGGAGITATGGGLTPDMVGRVLSVSASSPDHVLLKASPEALSADGSSRTTITASLVDRYGNNAVGSTTVNLNLSTSDHLTLTNPFITTGGSIQAIAKTTPGVTTISATSSGFVVTPVTIGTYIAGLPARAVIDSLEPAQAGNAFNNQVVVKGRVVDQNGNVVTSISTGADLTAMAVRITGSGGQNSTNITMSNTTGLSSHSIYPNGISMGAAMVLNGMAQMTLTNTRAETITLTPIVYYKGVELPATSTAFTTNPGPAALLSVSASPTTASTAFSAPVVVTASVSDVHGNPVGPANDTITFSLNTSSFLTMPSQTMVTTTTGSASISLQTKVNTSGGNTTITATSSLLGFAGSTTITVDLPPSKPAVLARNASGTTTTVGGGDLGAKLIVTTDPRFSNQTVIVYVNGVVVPMYTGVDFGTATDTITSGGSILIGYVKKADLGGLGQKDIRVVIQTPLGISPLSDSQILTVTP